MNIIEYSEKRGGGMEELGYDIVFPDSYAIRKVYIELTDRCNLNCKMCYRGSWLDKARDMDKGIFDKLVEDLKKVQNLKTVVLGGIGEPMYCKYFEEALHALKDYNIEITTNGTLINQNNIDILIDLVDTLTISIDGLCEKFYDIRGTSLENIIESLEMLNQKKKEKKSKTPNIQIQFVGSKDNIDEVYGVIKLAGKLKASKFIFSNVIPQSEHYKDKILYKDKGENPDMNILKRNLRTESFRYGMRLLMGNGELKTDRGCDFIDKVSTLITADGNVSPCYRFAHSYKEYVFGREKNVKAHYFGNLKTQSLLDIWNSEEYKRFKYRVHTGNYPSCMDCDLIKGCSYTEDTSEDCYGLTPSCGDCLWARKYVICP